MDCLNNPLGEGVHTVIKVFEETPRLRTLCGLEEGVEQVDWSKSNKGPADVALLAAELKAGRAANSVSSVTLRSTGNFGKTYTLTTGETTIVLSETNLGSADVGMLTSWLQRREVGSTIESFDFTGCEITPTHAMLVWSAANAVSRSRLRTAQVLAFASALHDRLGAECEAFDMADELTDVWPMVAEFVHARHGHEALCSKLARHRPWYKVRVRGPHVPCEEKPEEATSSGHDDRDNETVGGEARAAEEDSSSRRSPMQDESYDRSDRSRSASCSRSRPLSRDGCFDAVMSSPISAVGAVVVVVVAMFMAVLCFER